MASTRSVFNGEIYNFVALRGELEAAGRRFTTTSDTEVLFVALQELGVAGALERVQGMFAFVFHHAASATTHLARDRYGIKPLLYASTGSGWCSPPRSRCRMMVSNT